MKDKLIELMNSGKELNYKDLCNELGLVVKGGKGKVIQLKYIDAMCRREMTTKTKFKIAEVYDEELQVVDNRVTTLPSIECILMNILSHEGDNRLTRHENQNILFTSNTDLLYHLMLINDNGLKLLKTRKNDYNVNTISVIKNSYGFSDDFVDYIDNMQNVFTSSVKSALSSMEKRHEIVDYKAFKVKKIVDREYKFDYVTYMDDLGKELFKIRGEVDREFEERLNKNNSYNGLRIQMPKALKTMPALEAPYYERCNAICREKSHSDPKWIENGWDYVAYYNCHAIVCNETKLEYDLQELSKARSELSVKGRDKILTSKSLKKVNDNNKEFYWGLCNQPESEEWHKVFDEYEIINKINGALKEAEEKEIE